MTAPGEAVSLVVQNLRPGTRYSFKVSSENRHGGGSASRTLTARTEDEAPASPPRNVEIIPRGSSSLEVRWDAPPFSHWNSELLGYHVSYKRVGATSAAERADVQMSGEAEHSLLLAGLKRFSSYQVSVRGVNSKGEGPPSASVVATTLEDGELQRKERISHGLLQLLPDLPRACTAPRAAPTPC